MDDDDQPLERMDMENDYDGGVEIGGEFFYKYATDQFRCA